MPVYVDELHKWPSKIKCFKDGSCHMVADTDEELHKAASLLGLKREWFQNKRIKHYDLTALKRRQALRLGAFEDEGLRNYLKRRG